MERILSRRAPASRAARPRGGAAGTREFSLRHVNDLLDVARLEEGQARPSATRGPTSRGSCADRGAASRRAARERRIALAVNAPEGARRPRSTPSRSSASLANLVANAFQFVPDGGPPVRVEVAEGDGACPIAVADNGPGVPAAELAQRIFERFRQDEAGAARPGGAGLGLSIAKDFVDAPPRRRSRRARRAGRRRAVHA